MYINDYKKGCQTKVAKTVYQKYTSEKQKPAIVATKPLLKRRAHPFYKI